ncbi:ABC transporter ATP-binding protein [Desulfosediminicola flagellatus]|uniref:ABC transporter ATP-binding protein n=1 Tax=Desulfosediminicola flagellatus TaxID=2569541 RepID=UPI0010AD201C|nr:ABC transporter ATP-binding protein [Desulfosediminicola flagellatus]
MSALFEARGISKSYISGKDELTVLNTIDLSINAGEMAAIVGASGSGKTTLLQILGTLASPTGGDLFFKGERLTEKNDGELAQFRNKSLGFIFQFHHLLPEFSALENVMMPALIAGKKKKDVIEPATELLKSVELDHRLDHRVAELSGGEQQRTALARALIMKPALLLADEPTGNLDSRAGNLVFNLLEQLCRERSLSVIMVTHNMELARRMDIIFRLNEQRIIRE